MGVFALVLMKDLTINATSLAPVMFTPAKGEG